MKRILLVAALALPILTAQADFAGAVAAFEKKDYNYAFTEFKRLAEFGDVDSQRNLASMYFNGEGVEKDPIMASAWAQLAAESKAEETLALTATIDKRLNKDQRKHAQAQFFVLKTSYSSEALQEQLFPVSNDQMATCTVDVIGGAKLLSGNAPYSKELLLSEFQGDVRIMGYVSADGALKRVRIIDLKQLSGRRKFDTNYATFRNTKNLRFAPISEQSLSETPRLFRLHYRLNGVEFFSKAEREQFIGDITTIEQRANNGDAEAKYRLAYEFDYGKFGSLKDKQNYAAYVDNLYRDSAIGGYGNAQYLLAKRLLTGDRCEQDVEKGLTWLTLAAQQGQMEAQYLLANRLFSMNEREKAAKWLVAAAQSGHPRARIDYAMYLLTSAEGNTEKALELLKDLPTEDDIRALEVVALANAQQGKFEDAIATQAQVVEIATDMEFPLEQRQQYLTHFQARTLPPVIKEM